MSTKPFRVITFDPSIDRSGFSCGSESIDLYFRKYLTQDVKRNVTACFTALSTESGVVAGFYTLASSSVYLGDLPEPVRKKLPRYPSVPAVRLGRLAVDQAYKGKGLGGSLLADAMVRVMHSEIAAYAIVVDAIDENAASFYLHHGFIRTAEPLTLFLPLATVKQMSGIDGK